MKFNNHDPANGPGPVSRRLEEFGKIRAVVVGPRGECSPDLHSLVQSVGDIAAERSWRFLGARNPGEAKSIVTERFVRTIGLSAIRENAAQKRVALGISLDGGRNAAGRRSRGRHLFRNMQEEYEARYGRGPAPPRAH